VIWWASGWFARESPVGRLLFAQDAQGNVGWQGFKRPRENDAAARFAEIAALAPHAIAVEPARLGAAEHWRPARDGSDELATARFVRRIDTAWRRTSYSALTAAAHDAIVASEPEQGAITDEPEVASAPVASELPLSEMASGPQLGTLIHQALQEIDFAAADLRGELGAWLTAAVAHRPELLGCSPEQAAEGLSLALATPLGGELSGTSLAGVARADRLDELAFELPLAGGDEPVAAASLADVAALLGELLPADDALAAYAQRLADPMLAAALRGYLNGSIDLVLRVRGTEPGHPRDRYAIIDYKTNWLAPAGEPLSAAHYAAAELTAEMQRSHYVLQALLYSVALHRYLRWRLPGYDPDIDLAGIRYLFVRGMLGPSRPDYGVFAWHPPAVLVVALSDMLAGGDGR
jgi:exodeoxyribonuclease V beta subunit